MALTINTNISSIISQRSFASATELMNRSIERMTTGYKINHASDNAAGYSISKMWETQLGSLDMASGNAAIGADLLTTAEENYDLLSGHIQRIRDLTEQAANGTYGSASLKAIRGEVDARLREVIRIAAGVEFNGIKLMSYVEGEDNTDVGITANGLNIQVGLYANETSRINLSVDLFSNASISGIFNSVLSNTSESGKTLKAILEKAGDSSDISKKLNLEEGLIAFSAACSSLVYDSTSKTFALQTDKDFTAKEMLGFLDDAIEELSDRVTKIGSAQNRIASAIESIDVQSKNITSSLSTLRDTDVAEESSNFIQAQILQQASATLLSTANQLPSVALNLI